MRKFDSPDALWKYSLAVAAEMMQERYEEQSRILEEQAKLVCTTGREWLEELLTGVEKIKSIGPLPKYIDEKLLIIEKTAKSDKPYG